MNVIKAISVTSRACDNGYFPVSTETHLLYDFPLDHSDSISHIRHPEEESQLHEKVQIRYDLRGGGIYQFSS